MGASFNTVVYPDKIGQRAIADRWSLDVDRSLEESGNSYSGEIGMLGHNIVAWNDLNLTSEVEADSWLANHHEKWEPAQAVSFTRSVLSPEQQAKYDAGRKKLDEAVDHQVTKLSKILVALADKFVSQKSQYCSCKKCGSKLNHNYLKPHIPTNYSLKSPWDPDLYKGVACPVCGEKMYSEAAYARIKTEYKKIQKALEAYNSFKPNFSAKSVEKYWMVGGWCSS